MAASEQIFITKIDPKDRIILLEFKKQENGQTIDCKGKAFKSAEPHLKLNTKMDAVVEWEEKEGFPPGWVVKPVAAQGGGGGFKGGGGPGKADPAKIAIEQGRLDLEGQKQSYIIAQVILKEAVAMAIALNSPDSNTVQACAQDLGEIYADTLKQTIQTLAADKAGGK